MGFDSYIGLRPDGMILFGKITPEAAAWIMTISCTVAIRAVVAATPVLKPVEWLLDVTICGWIYGNRRPEETWYFRVKL